MAEQRLIVVGTGPAGVRAAQALVECGLRPIVVDEAPRDGGQIYRRQPQGFTRPYGKLYGTEAPKAEALHACFEGLKPYIDYRPATLVWHAEPGRLHVIEGTEPSVLDYDRLLVCSGATDRLLPLKGWHYAGCYSLGASQIALKAQACAIGSRIVFIGTGPLLYLVASQYVGAGARVEAVLDTSTLAHRVRALPLLAARPALLLKGLLMTASLLRAGVEVRTGVTPVEIAGTPESGVSGLTVRCRNGSLKSYACDAVGLGYHLRAESQIADLAHCAFLFDQPSRQWMPRIDEDGRSSDPAIYLAGDGARILGADGAELAGRLAALAALTDSGVRVFGAEDALLRRRLKSMEQFRRGLLKAFPWPYQLASSMNDDTVVCRCECITVGELRRSVSELGAGELNRAKALSRVGMGRCQGRYCAHAAAEIVAATARIPIQEVGRLRGQGPVKPLPMAATLVEGELA